MTARRSKTSAPAKSAGTGELASSFELIFFTGKGGVGKTTVAAAYALWRAHERKRERILLLSTDPAHSLGDILQRKLPRREFRLSSRLTVHEIDAEARFRDFLDEYREPLVSAIEAGTVFTREEIEPLLSSTLPGMAEISALLAISDALNSGRFDRIVVDTAPFGHTLRLFQLPEAFQKLLRFLEVASSRDAVLAAHFGGHAPAPNPLLAQWQQMLDTLLGNLRQRARLVLVTTAEPFALNESARVAQAMAALQPPMQFDEVVLNRVSRSNPHCPKCKAQKEAAQQALRLLKREFRGRPLRIAADPGMPILGGRMLLRFGQQLFGGRSVRLVAKAPTRAPSLKLARAKLPLPEQQLSLTVGKGGVGKTTISAALALRLRDATLRASVAVCSTDPAPSLDDVFEQQVGDELKPVLGDRRLLAAEIDAAAEFHAWAARMKAQVAGAFSGSSKGVHVDLSFERRLFEALLDTVPPGLDEVFSVLRLSELTSNPRSASASEGARRYTGLRIVLDMAPTGHALELLRTPERILNWSRLLLKSLAAHRALPFARDLGAEIAEFASRVRRLSAQLQRHDQTAAWVVMLAEPLPDRETARLLRQLRELDVTVAAVFINRLLLAAPSKCPQCRLRAGWQQATLRRTIGMLRKSGIDSYCVAEQENAVSGRGGLEELASAVFRFR